MIEAILYPYTSTSGTSWMFFCPGCLCGHSLDGRWAFDGNTEAPTFRPSLLSTYGPDNTKKCHLFIEDGKLRFLKDCTHELAGQTVPMEPFPW